MHIIKVKCESCGAALKIDDESDIIKCEYCGTSLKLLRKEAPKAPDPAPQAQSHSYYYRTPNYYTQIVENIKATAKKVAWYARPLWIIVFVSVFVVVALSIIIPTVIYSSDTYNDFLNGENGTVSGGDTSGTSQLPSNPMTPIVYNGTGDKVVSGIDLSKGNYYTKLTHNGSSNFIVKFYYGSNSYDYISLANKIGEYTGYRLLDDVLGVAVTGGSLEIRANGNWTITIYEISEISGSSVSGKGDHITGVISGLSGRKTVTMTHNGSSNFIVKIYTYNGGKYGYDSAANKIGNYSGQTSVSFKTGSKYFFSIQANGDWTVSIS